MAAIELLVSKLSKAKFKVGFSNVDARIHHFMLSMELNKYKEFVSESFRYLKITGQPIKKLPSWHQGKGTPGWFFMSEITVN